MTNYLRNRPFLLIKQTLRPVKNAPTNVKGWMDNTDNFIIYEIVTIVDAIKDKHRIESSLIIDIMKQKIIKNSIDNNHDIEILDLYMKKYNEQITSGTTLWMNKIKKNTDSKKVSQILEALDIKPPAL